MRLDKPTVSDVIKLLQTMPQDAPFKINTSDTYWTEDIVHIKMDKNGKVWFCGEMRK
jgi:hypothetical protein